MNSFTPYQIAYSTQVNLKLAPKIMFICNDKIMSQRKKKYLIVVFITKNEKRRNFEDK